METARLEMERVPGGQNGDLVTLLRGKLSLETVSTFIQTMRQEPASHLVLDMSGVSFLDSSGVGALVSLFVTRQHAGEENGAGQFDEAGFGGVAGVGLDEIDSGLCDGGRCGQRGEIISWGSSWDGRRRGRRPGRCGSR